MIDKKVMVKNETNSRLGINLPDIQLKRIWEKKGAIKPIPFDTLQQALYSPGVEYMFKQGMLSIEDRQVRIDLGLEEEDSTTVVVLSDEQKRRYLSNLPMREFKEELGKLQYEQINSLVDYAIQEELTNMDKCEYLKKVTGIDIIRAIQLNRQAQEE